MTLLYVLSFFVLALHREIGAQNPCLTPNNRTGACINIRNCSALLEILRRFQPLPQDQRDFLIRSQCGWDGRHPKVCCEEELSVPVPVTQVTATESTPTFPNPPDVSNHPNLRLLPDECGSYTMTKIIDGNRTRIFDYPWMALLAYDTGKPTKEFRCGGTIISERYILTAAHCVTGLPTGVRLVEVRLGEHDLRTEQDCEYYGDNVLDICAGKYREYGVERVDVHPDVTADELSNDIGLIRVNTNIDFSSLEIKPICLPIGDAATILGRRVTVTGWGTTEVGVRSQVLLKVLLRQTPVEECQNIYNNTQISYKQICAGGNKPMDSCVGDSGGPLQAVGLYKGSIRDIQQGIFSSGLCGILGFPGRYTRIAYYLDWILNTMTE